MTSSNWRLVIVVILGEVIVLGASMALAIISPNLGSILSGAATLVLAGLTVIILYYNAGVLNATKDAAAATKEAADATRDEAEATREEARATREQAEASIEQAKIANESLAEVRLGREMDARPFVVRLAVARRVTGGRLIRDVALDNIGRGPALNCIYACMDTAGADRRVCLRTGAINLRSGGNPVNAPAEQSDDHMDRLLFEGVDQEDELLICHDHFGNAFRFIPGRSRPEIWPHNLAGSTQADEPAWIKALTNILERRQPTGELESGPHFREAVAITVSFNRIHATMVLEAVPASDLAPGDLEMDVIHGWASRIQPSAQRASLDIGRWTVETSAPGGPDWWASLMAGPCLQISQVLESQLTDTPPDLTGIVGNLRLLELVDWWRQMIRDGLVLMTGLQVKRVRLGFTLITSGAYDQPRFIDVDFSGVVKPETRIAPTYGIRNVAYVSEPFHVHTWPAGDLEAAVLSVLRTFGYRDVDAQFRSSLRLNVSP